MYYYVRLPLLAVMLTAVACSISPARPDSEVAAPTQLAKQLVSIIVHSSLDDKQLTAAMQVRRMARVGQISASVMKPLLGEWGIGWLEGSVVCQALAAKGHEVEGALLEGVRSGRLWLMEALAQIPDPSAEVTAELSSMAEKEPSHYGRRMYALALAARGDKSQDWGQELARYLADHAEYIDEAKRLRFWTALCYVAPKLKGSAALEERLWEVATDGVNDDTSWFALIVFAQVAHTPVAPARVEHLQTILRRPGDEAYVAVRNAIIHLELACLGVEPQSEIQKAVDSVGSVRAMGEERKALVLPCDVLISEDLLTIVKKSLSSGSPVTQIGAVRFTQAIGPDAHDMMTDLDRLVPDPDTWRAMEVCAARLRVGGLGPNGNWVFQEDAKRFGWEWVE